AGAPHPASAHKPDRSAEPQHPLDAMHPPARRDTAPEQPALRPLARPHGPCMVAPGEQREQSWPIAALGRDREVVALEQPHGEPEALAEARLQRHRDDAIDIRIALE